MPAISDSHYMVTLPSGNKAVYGLQANFDMENGACGESLSERAIKFGKQIAHAKDDNWYKPGGWEQITDLRTIALLERCPDA